jgi:hypothetical protein
LVAGPEGWVFYGCIAYRDKKVVGVFCVFVRRFSRRSWNGFFVSETIDYEFQLHTTQMDANLFLLTMVPSR